MVCAFLHILEIPFERFQSLWLKIFRCFTVKWYTYYIVYIMVIWFIEVGVCTQGKAQIINSIGKECNCHLTEHLNNVIIIQGVVIYFQQIVITCIFKKLNSLIGENECNLCCTILKSFDIVLFIFNSLLSFAFSVLIDNIHKLIRNIVYTIIQCFQGGFLRSQKGKSVIHGRSDF